MEKDILNFMSKVEIINKDFSRYVDKEKGIVFSLNTVQLLPRLDYLELDKTQFEAHKFEGKIDKNLEYNIIDIDKPTSKYSITKKEEDKFNKTIDQGLSILASMQDELKASGKTALIFASEKSIAPKSTFGSPAGIV